MKISLLILSIFVLAFYGCKIIDELTHFDIDYNYTFTLPALGGLNLPEEIESPDVENNTESTFVINDTRKDLVERATLKKFNITILEPAEGNFRFLSKIEIFVETDALDAKLIAWKYDIPTNIDNFLELKTTSSDLRKYLTSDAIRVRLKTTSSSPLTEDLLLDLKSTVEVDAKILGI